MTINILDIEFEDYLEEISEMKELLYLKFNWISEVEKRRLKAKEEGENELQKKMG